MKGKKVVATATATIMQIEWKGAGETLKPFCPGKAGIVAEGNLISFDAMLRFPGRWQPLFPHFPISPFPHCPLFTFPVSQPSQRLCMHNSSGQLRPWTTGRDLKRGGSRMMLMMMGHAYLMESSRYDLWPNCGGLGRKYLLMFRQGQAGPCPSIYTFIYFYQ